MPKAAKRERSPIPRDKIKKMWEDGRSYEYMARHTGRYNEGKADPTKSMRAIVSQLLTSEFLKAREGMRGQGGTKKAAVKTKAKGKKAAGTKKQAAKVVKAKGKKVASTKGFQKQQPPTIGVNRDEAGNLVELTLSQPKVLIANQEFLNLFGNAVDQIRGEAVAVVVGVAAQSDEFKVPEGVVGQESTTAAATVDNQAAA
jgi:hypothetical protein